MNRGRSALVMVLLLAFAGTALADHHQAPKMAAAAGFGYQASVIGQLDDAEKKLIQLAEAMPDDKFGWRPGEGVRSFAEVLLHTAAGNYFFGKMLGVALPEGVDPMNIEKGSKEKAAVIAQLKSSFAFSREVIKGIPDDQLGASMKIFGQDGSKGTMLMIYATHAHEHLGQAIAYARTAGVVPPWSAKS